MYFKGVVYWDFKFENIFLLDIGNFKIVDFGMLIMFEYKGVWKQMVIMCGSFLYIVFEVLQCVRLDKRLFDQQKYLVDLVDIWFCGVILFVFLVGNILWDELIIGSWEFQEYVWMYGWSIDQLWQRIFFNILFFF